MISFRRLNSPFKHSPEPQKPQHTPERHCKPSFPPSDLMAPGTALATGLGSLTVKLRPCTGFLESFRLVVSQGTTCSFGVPRPPFDQTGVGDFSQGVKLYLGKAETSPQHRGHQKNIICKRSQSLMRAGGPLDTWALSRRGFDGFKTAL